MNGRVLCLAFPTNLGSVLRHADPIVSGLQKLSLSVSERSLAIGTTPTAPAHLLARALLSAREAGLEPSILIGQGPDGGIAHATVRIENALTAETPFHVRIRPGGYLIDSNRGSLEIARLRTDKGLEYDLKRLAGRARKLSVRTAGVSFVSNVPAAALTETISTLAGEGIRVSILLP